MKVAVISREHPDHFNGGLSIAAWNSARAARDAGCEVVFITATRPDGFSGSEHRDKIEIVWTPGTTNTDYPLFHAVILGVFPKLHADRKFDLVHGHGYSAAPIAIKGIDVPILFHDHGSKEGYVQSVLTAGVLQGRGEACLPQAVGFIKDVYFAPAIPARECDFTHMRKYDRVLATSSISLWDFRTRYLLKNAVGFRHCIYDLEKFSSASRAASSLPVIAVFAGDLEAPWKVGKHALKRLLPMKDEVTLRMIGPGVTLAAWARTKFPRVEYTGHLPEARAMEQLSTVDVLFESSTHHLGLNLTGISALGLGVPIVAYTTGGHWDMVGEDGEAGMLLDPMTGSVPKAIRRVLARRKSYSEAAKKRFDRIFSPTVCSRSIKTIYEGVL